MYITTTCTITYYRKSETENCIKLIKWKVLFWKKVILWQQKSKFLLNSVILYYDEVFSYSNIFYFPQMGEALAMHLVHKPGNPVWLFLFK